MSDNSSKEQPKYWGIKIVTTSQELVDLITRLICKSTKEIQSQTLFNVSLLTPDEQEFKKDKPSLEVLTNINKEISDNLKGFGEYADFPERSKLNPYRKLSDAVLAQRLQEAVDEENYTIAAMIRDEINRRKKK